jgi:hypothetical protein
MEDKVEVMLRQNNILQGENDKLTRLLHQHKA